MSLPTFRAGLWAFCLLLFACSGRSSPEPDASEEPPDDTSGEPATGEDDPDDPDTGEPDDASSDALDAGVMDASATSEADAGARDAQALDARAADNVRLDAQVVDAQRADAQGAGEPYPLSLPRCEGPRFVTRVVEERFAEARNSSDAFGRTNMPEVVYGPPRKQRNDLVSLGNGGSITLAFDALIVDGPGVDFIVFENPFANFFELATVAVSADGVDFISFPCTAAQSRLDRDDTDYGTCAGWHPVTEATDPTWTAADYCNPALAGGDQYDLSDLPGNVDLVRYVRITDRVDLVASGDTTSPAADAFDLDAVSLVNARCP